MAERRSRLPQPCQRASHSPLPGAQGLAARLDEIALYDLPLDTPARYLAEVARLQPEELARLAETYLFPESALIVAVGPAEELRRELQELGEPELWSPPQAIA